MKSKTNRQKVINKVTDYSTHERTACDHSKKVEDAYDNDQGNQLSKKGPTQMFEEAENYNLIHTEYDISEQGGIYIKEQIQEYIEDNGNLSNNQHGFRKNKSCISQIWIHTELITNARK